MNKNLTFIGGAPRVRVSGYVLTRGTAVEVPEELAKRIEDAQTQELTNPDARPQFLIEDLV